MTNNWLNELGKKLESVRKDLHSNYPELSGQEFKTTERIKQYLKDNTNAEIVEVGRNGILAIFKGENEGNTILLRADTDALPIQEINDFEHKSKFDNISHKCGHDGHTAIMLGMAEALSKFPITKGAVILLWQPSEENGMGAQNILSDKYFTNLKIDYVFALHNLPGYNKHEIVLKEGNFTSHVKSLVIKLVGKTAHAAEPEFGHNPALAISKIIDRCEQVTHNVPESDEFFLITPVYINLGSKSYGISAGDAEIHLTIRSWFPELFDTKCSELLSFASETANNSQLKCSFSWTQEFYANQNHKNAVEYLHKVVKEENLIHHYQSHPFKWGEDFGLFTQKYKGAMFGLGASKDTPALHNPDYDYPDDITITGIRMFMGVVKRVLE